jgi:hypothetical protein
MAKVAKLILSYPHRMLDPSKREPHYRVVRSQHTTEFNPGDHLSKAQVDELNASTRWDVSTVAAEK